MASSNLTVLWKVTLLALEAFLLLGFQRRMHAMGPGKGTAASSALVLNLKGPSTLKVYITQKSVGRY